jgi:hypothetical protein
MKTAHLPKKRRPPFGYIYPVFCGLVVGGMLGGLMHSLFMFALFGGMAWLYLYLDFFHVLPAGGVPVACDARADWQSSTDLNKDLINSSAHSDDSGGSFDLGFDVSNPSSAGSLGDYDSRDYDLRLD